VKDQSPRLKALLAEKLTLMREGLDVSTKLYQQGRGELQDVIQWQRELHQAELEVCTTDPERIAVWTQALASAKEFEKIARTRKQAALASSSEVLRASAYRLDVEIALERLNSK
jgi:outer membrane protein TolC